MSQHLINGAKLAINNAEEWLAMIKLYPNDDAWFLKCYSNAEKCSRRAEDYLKSAGVE
jgi:hypothetical protein